MTTCQTTQDLKKVVGNPSHITDLGKGIHLWIYDAPIDATTIDDVGGFSADIANDGKIISRKPIYTFKIISRNGNKYKVNSIHEKLSSNNLLVDQGGSPANIK